MKTLAQSWLEQAERRCPATQDAMAACVAAALPQQREMLASPARKKAALCGRRAGKTYGCDVGLIAKASATPGVVCPYVCLTKTSARYITWPVLHQIEREHHLSLAFDEQRLIVRLPNGSEVLLLGADSQTDMDRLRGGKYARVVIDEAGVFPRDLLGYLIDEVLEAATTDLLGDIWLVGTPNPAALGYFHDVTTGPRAWPTWSWTIRENTYLPHGASELARIMAEHGWTLDSPIVQREWLGRWVRDVTGLVYRFERARHVQAAPDTATHHVLAIDLGASEHVATTAFVVLAYSDHDTTQWIVRAEKHAALGPDGIATRIQELMASDKPERIVCDPGGLGGGYIKHFVETRRLPVEPCEKKDKAGTIELLNGEFDGGRLRIDPACTELLSEIEILPWNEKRTDAKEGCADHCCDAMLYAWRAAYAYAQEPVKPKPPERGTPEWMAAYEQRMRDDATRRAKRGRAGWWEKQT